jgi:hypothetical protein
MKLLLSKFRFMKKYLIIAALSILSSQLHAQWLKLMAFPVTDYVVEANDSVTIVQIKLPPGFSIKEKTYGQIRSVFHTAGDSIITVGSGRCYLIKEDYCYYGLQKKYMRRKPVAGDLLYTDVSIPACYDGYLFEVIRHNIIINSVEGNTIADLSSILQIKTADDELPVLSRLMEDVKYTAKVMSEENNNQNMLITAGKFKDQKLFAAMQAIAVADVKDFLRYINARPEKYAGNTWKFCEIMATWMVEAAPTVVQ